MQGMKAAATKKDQGPIGAQGKQPTSAKKATMSGEGHAAQEQSLEPGGAADQAKMAGLECGGRSGSADPKPYEWSVSYSRTALSNTNGSKPQRTGVKVHTQLDWVGLNPDGSVSMMQGTQYLTIEKGEDAVVGEEKAISPDVPGNVALFTAELERAKAAPQLKGLKPKPPSEATVAPFKACT